MNRTNIIGTVVIVLIILTAYSFLTSGFFKRKVAVYTGYSEICIDGVKYIQFISGASVKYNLDGSIHLCKN